MILFLLVVFVGGALMLFAARAGALEAKGVFQIISRESALVANNLLLCVAAFVIFIGTIWPLVSELAFNRVISVGEPFFNAAFTPFFVGLALILPIGSTLAWKRGDLNRSAFGLWPVAALAIAIAGLAYAVTSGRTLLGPIGAGLGAWIIFGALADIWGRTGRGDLAERLSRLTRQPRADWGRIVAHAGMGSVIFAAAAMTAWVSEDIRVLKTGESFALGGYEVQMVAVSDVQGPNYSAVQAEMRVTRDGAEVVRLYPEKRFYPVAGMPTTEAAIDYGLWRDLYLVIGDPQEGGGWAVRSYIKPFANWLWGGALLMAFGGLLSLTDRRYRVAAGRGRVPAAAVSGAVKG